MVNKMAKKELRRASKFLHSTVHKLVDGYKPKKVLDLGSGYGGLPLRLSNAGYDVTITDLNPEMSRKHGMKCLKLDLNKEVKVKTKYDLVTCTEVIEHLYNPKKLFVDAYNLLNDDGVFIFTTPNNQNWFSRVYMLLTGKFPSFHGQEHVKYEYDFEPHITPIFVWQVKLLIRTLFKIEKVTFNRSVVPVIHINLPIKNLFFGQNLIIVLKKK